MSGLPGFDTEVDGDDGERINVVVQYERDQESGEVSLVTILAYNNFQGADEIPWIWEDDTQLAALLQEAYDDDQEKWDRERDRHQVLEEDNE